MTAMLNRNPDILIDSISEDKTIVFNPKRNTTYVLNTTATYLLNLCQNKPLKEVVKMYTERFLEMCPSKRLLTRDARIICAQLLELGLVEET